MMRLKRTIAPLLVCLASSAVCVLPLEWLARYWIRSRGDPLDRAMTVLRLDARLGWRQRAGLSTTFYGFPLRTNELGLRAAPMAEAARARQRILVLGPSSAFGWGVAEEETYSRRLESLLREAGLTDLAVVNAGEIGFSVWQGLELYRSGELRALQPHLVLIAYGLNDVDRYRFAFHSGEPDSVGLGRGQSRLSVDVQNALNRLQLLQLSRRKILAVAGRLARPAPAAPGVRPALRVPLPEFGVLLRELVRRCRADGARVVLLTSAYKLPPGPPLASTPRPGRMPPDEPWRIRRDLTRYNQEMTAVAASEGVPVVDAVGLLEGPGQDERFVDPAHPSAVGHARIAAALRKAITEHQLLGD